MKFWKNATKKLTGHLTRSKTGVDKEKDLVKPEDSAVSR